MIFLKSTNSNMKSFILFIFFAANLISCKQKDSGNSEIVYNSNGILYKADFNTFVKSHDLSAEDYQKIIVIPGVGCTGCISEAQSNYNKNYKDTHTLYIFTAIVDLKIFKNTLPEDAENYKNSIIDDSGALLDLGYKSIYPCELSLSDADTVSIKIL